MKKIFRLLTAMSVIIALVFTTTVTASAATVKISKKKVNLFVGQTITLKIKGTTAKVKWSTSKKSVATVSAKGKVTAKKAGVAKITGKVNGKKYTCTVTVKNQVGSRQNPADPTKGVTIENYTGKYYFKLNNVYRHTDAVNKVKEFGVWDLCSYQYDDKEVGTDLLVMEFSAKAISGFDEFALNDTDIISFSQNYNENSTAAIDDFDLLFCMDKNINNLSLFGGGEGTFYFCAFVPDDLTTFTQYQLTKSFEKYWIKFNI